MIFCIGSQSTDRLSSWRRLLGCRNSRTLSNSWLESRFRWLKGSEETELLLYEHRGQNPAADIPFLMGYLWHEEFSAHFAGSPVLVLHTCEGGDDGLVLHNPVDLGSQNFYPDIILGHDFHEEIWSPEAGSFHYHLYTNLMALLSPHQLLGFTLNSSLERSRIHQLINMLKGYARNLENVHREDRMEARRSGSIEGGKSDS